MDKVKQWVALAVVGALAILAAGWFLLVSPKRSDAADLRTRTDQQEQTNQGLQARLEALKVLQKTQPSKQAQLAVVAAKIPDNPAMPSLIRALTAAAADAGVELVSLDPSAPAPLAAPAAATTLKAPTAGATAKPAASGTGLSQAAAAGQGAVGTLEQIPLNLNVVGTYFQVEQFFDRVEHLSRAMKVTGFSLAPGTSPTKVLAPGASGAALAPPSTLSATITATVYMSSGRAAAIAALTSTAAK